MKKNNILFLFLMISGLISTAYGQKLYTSLSVGYGFKSGATNIDRFSDRTRTSTTDTEELLKISLGKGVAVDGVVGFNITDNFRGEVGVSYLLGSTYSATDDNQNAPRLRKYELGSKMLRLSPTLVFASKVGSVVPYFKLGMVIGFGKINYSFYEDDAGVIEKQEWEFKEGTSIGFKAGGGVEFPISDKLTFFSELVVINQNFAPETGQLTTWSIDGVNELPNATYKDKNIKFVDKINYDKNITDTQADEELRQHYPFGSLNLQAGVKYIF